MTKRSDPITGLCGTLVKTGLTYEENTLSMTYYFRLLGMNKSNF